MESLMLFFLVWFIYCLIKLQVKLLKDESDIQKRYYDKVEAAQMNMYTISEAHQLLMERVRIQDMEMHKDFIPMQQQFQLEKWYNKVGQYSYRYFRSLNDIEDSIENNKNKVINLAQRAQPFYQQYEEHDSQLDDN
jgi:hypothetical protein